jgi:hypothetical protein
VQLTTNFVLLFYSNIHDTRRREEEEKTRRIRKNQTVSRRHFKGYTPTTAPTAPIAAAAPTAATAAARGAE